MPGKKNPVNGHTELWYYVASMLINLIPAIKSGQCQCSVQARDAASVKVLNGSGIYTDWRGYAVVPYLNPYNRNQISLDVNSVKDNVELLNTDVTTSLLEEL